jgi:hypothetical protein
LNVIALSAVFSASGVLEVDLVLAGGDLVVGGLDPDAERLEGVDHVLADLLGEVGREVEVAGLVVGKRADAAVRSAPEEEELELGPGVDDVAELPGALDLAAEDGRGSPGERLAGRGEHVADHARRAPRAGRGLPRDLGERAHVGHQVLVALGDPGEALDRAAVEPRPVADGPLELVDRDRDGLDDAEDVGELELDEADAALAGVGDLLGSVDLLARDHERSCLRVPRPVA